MPKKEITKTRQTKRSRVQKPVILKITKLIDWSLGCLEELSKKETWTPDYYQGINEGKSELVKLKRRINASNFSK